MSEKLQTLAEDYGFDNVQDFIEDTLEQSLFGAHSGVPAICMNEDCDYITEMEPDQDAGWCELCDTQSVSSALIIGGFI